MVETEEDLKKLPIGIPFMRGTGSDEYEWYVRLLEFHVLLESAKASGLPFNWKKLLKESGYGEFIKGNASSGKELSINGEFCEPDEYIRDTSFHVDLEFLKNLKLIPGWFADIESNIKENILNTILYNPNLYNKKMDLVTGDAELKSPVRNLIIIDISGSIPKSISESILALAKTMGTMYYADLLITGSKSTLYDYSKIDELDVTKAYYENGTDNDQVFFINLVKQYRRYNNVISFGDNHSPGHKWRNEYNKKSRAIPLEEGINKYNKWEVNKIYSFHTHETDSITGYASWFGCKNVEYMKNWVEDLN